MPSTTIYANKGARIADEGSFESGAGASDYLPTGLYSGFLYRALLGFSYSFSGWTGITAATLHVRTSPQFYVAFGSDPDVYVERIVENWSEGSSSSLSSSNAVTWANQPSVTSSNRVIADITTAESTWVSIDITGMMQAALASGVFYGVRLRAVDEGSAADVSEFYSDDTTSKPYITVTYSTNNPPNAPVNLSPTGNSIQQTLSPIFSGTSSDPDAGDGMTGVEIYVYADDMSSVKWAGTGLPASGTSFSKVYAGSSLTGNTFYQWKARTKDNAGALGPWSALQRFKVNSAPTVPSVSIAGNAADQTTLSPTFFITHNDPDPGDSNMVGYQVIVYRDSDGAIMWNSGAVNVSPIRTLTLPYGGTALSWQTGYHIFARTEDSNGAWGPYADALFFTTHATAAPVSLSPSGSTVAGSLAPTLVGSRGQSNDSLTSVQIQLYAADAVTLIWDSGIVSAGVTTSGFAIPYGGPALSNATTYKWRARVTGAIGGTSVYSGFQTFITPDTNSPSAVAPIGTGITDLTPDITFSRGASFNRHELTVYESDGVTVKWTDAPASYASVTSKTVTYAGPALAFGNEYQWKVRVSSDGGTTWSPYAGPVSFNTDIAGLPTLTSPIDDSWQTTLTPTFTGDTANAETIATFRVKVYSSDGATLIWDSGDIAGSGTSFSTVYAGLTALVEGNAYLWTASYVKTGGAPGGDAPVASFHINAKPKSPTAMSPSSNEIVGTLTPAYTATYEDVDIANWGDSPTLYEVEVYRNSNNALMHALSSSTGLIVGPNSVTRGAGQGSPLGFETYYKWRARYTDSKGAVGTWSPYVLFKPSQPPTVTVDAPAATISSPGFLVSWTFSSPGLKAQQAFRVLVTRTADEVLIYDTGKTVSSDSSWTLPSGYLQNGETYTVEVDVWDTDDITASDTVDTTASWTPPPAPASFDAASDPATSTVKLSWEASTLAPTDFSFYQVYRKQTADTTFTPYATLQSQSETSFVDQLAANQTPYDYTVTVFQQVPGDVDLESAQPDPATGFIDLDGWFVIGADGSAEHSLELPVVGESHQKPIQQEVFEPLGAKRKKTARGNTLGNEGSLDCVWAADEREKAKAFLTYIAETQGPHILKSPFGDVWEVEFAGPQYKYAPAGGVAVTIAWIEVA